MRCKINKIVFAKSNRKTKTSELLLIKYVKIMKLFVIESKQFRDMQSSLCQLTTHMWTLIMQYNRFCENGNEAVEEHIP